MNSRTVCMLAVSVSVIMMFDALGIPGEIFFYGLLAAFQGFKTTILLIVGMSLYYGCVALARFGPYGYAFLFVIVFYFVGALICMVIGYLIAWKLKIRQRTRY